jgi:6-phosphofructokinase 1
MVSLLGIGSSPIGDADMKQEEVNRLIAAAIDAGINYIDTAPIYDLAELRLVENVCEAVMERDRSGRKFAIIVVAEGASEEGGEASLIGESLPGQERRVGGVAQRLARAIQDRTGKECRSLVLGHLQRGGMPTGYDRLLATRFGGAAAQAVADGKWGHMVALQTPNIVTVPITEALRVAKRVDPEHDVVQTARRLGIAFGD